MKVIVFVKATPGSEAGALPTQQLIEDMTAYNDELVKAGIMKGGDGLRPSKYGKRVLFSKDGRKSYVDGPFAETKELIAGFWLWEVKSMDEAMQWIARCPPPMPGEESIVEVRPFIQPEDFGVEFTPELQQRWNEQQAEIERQQRG